MRESGFAMLARRLQGYTGPRYPFHIGDNVLTPPETAEWGRFDPARLGNPYRYASPNGEEVLRLAVAEKLRHTNGLDVGPDEVLITVGATHGIACIFQALLDPGDEVLILAPHWPLVRGIALCAGVVPVEVPFYQALLDQPHRDVSELISPYVTPRTRLLYVISPNNPNGLVLTASQLDALGAVAERHGLWLLADEAYEHYAFARPHVSLASRPGLASRTVSAFTFSKSYALAGTRVGYVAGPTAAIAAMRKVATHSVYNVALSAQVAALGALETGQAVVLGARERFQHHARLVAERLGGHAVQGGSFAFVKLSEGGSAMPLLERAADRGVTLAPGDLFGSGFAAYARLCFTACDTPTLVEGLDVLADVIRSA